MVVRTPKRSVPILDSETIDWFGKGGLIDDIDRNIHVAKIFLIL
jgi:hypothetical protein